MATIILFDNEIRERLLPLTYTRPVSELRIGTLTIREKWERWMNMPSFHITQDYLAGKFGLDYSDVNYVINGSVLPSPQLCELIRQMEDNTAYVKNDELIVAKVGVQQLEKLIKDEEIEELQGFDIQDTQYLKVNYLWDLFQINKQAIIDDFELLTEGKQSAPISATNQVLGKENIFLEEGVQMECAILNATQGPIYISSGAEIMEGAIIRGPVSIGPNSVVKMGAKISKGSTIGPYCKAGGEISKSIMLAYSNKGHYGYLGCSVLGEWCNIGAGTSVSNLKNNYANAKVWDYESKRFMDSGTQFCGLFMGDHSKTAINCSINTGTVIGVGVNLYGSGFPRNFIPSFSWGSPKGYQTHKVDKAFMTAEKVMGRRKVNFTPEERLIMLRIFEDSAKFRKWEK